MKHPVVALSVAFAIASCSCARRAGPATGTSQEPGERRQFGQPPDGKVSGEVCRTTRTARLRSLDRQPKLLWQVDLKSQTPHEAVALSKDRLGVSAGNSMFVFDKTGKLIQRHEAELYVWVSAPVADADGNFYFAGLQAVSLDRDGKMRWRVQLRSDDARKTPPSPFVLSPDGVLYSAQNDGVLKAINKDTGALLWQQHLPPESTSLALWSRVTMGTRDRILVDTPSPGFLIYDRVSGKLLAAVSDTETNEVGAAAAPAGFGILGGITISDSSSRLILYDVDGTRKWSTVADGMKRPMYVNHDGNLVFSEYLPGQQPPVTTVQLRQFPCAGSPRAPVSLEFEKPAHVAMMILGADGVGYGATYPASFTVTSTSQILTVDRDLKPLWSLTLTGRRVLPGMALDSDGVLYATVERASDLSTELIAIQTASPGRASTPWSGLRNDNGQTGWFER